MSGSLIRHYSKANTAFLCCDLQERFSTIIPHFGQYVQVVKRFSAATTVIPYQICDTEFSPSGKEGFKSTVGPDGVNSWRRRYASASAWEPASGPTEVPVGVKVALVPSELF